MKKDAGGGADILRRIKKSSAAGAGMLRRIHKSSVAGMLKSVTITILAASFSALIMYSCSNSSEMNSFIKSEYSVYFESDIDSNLYEIHLRHNSKMYRLKRTLGDSLFYFNKNDGDSVFVNLSLGESQVDIDEIPSTFGFFTVKANGFRENKIYRMVRIFHKTDLEIDQINSIINDFSRDVDSMKREMSRDNTKH